MDIKTFRMLVSEATRTVATQADHAKALLPVPDLSSYSEWADVWFRYITSAALLKP